MSTIDTAPATRPRTILVVVHRLAYAVATLPLAAGCLAVLVAGWSIVLSLSFTPLVVPLLVAFAAGLRFVADVESQLARSLLAARIDPIPPNPTAAGFWAKAGARLRSGAFWRRQAFCLLRMLVGLPLACVSLSLIAGGLGYATSPIWYRWVPQDGGRHGIDLGIRLVDTLPESLALVPLGLLVAFAGVGVLALSAAAWRSLAEELLPGDWPDRIDPPPVAPPHPRTAGWPAPRPGAAVSGRPRARARSAPSLRALFVHGITAAVIVALTVTTWATTSRGYFWPIWVALPLAAAVAWHTVVVVVLRRAANGWRMRLATPALAMHAGVALVLAVALVAVWAVTWRGYPWWSWATVALAVPVAIHWIAVLSGSIGRLEQRRSQAVDVQEGDLRRIERDLHDGAQARLVALGLHLGMAEQKLASDPEAARALVGEARDGVQAALAELRDLVRGIRPPVLADRGLEAAIWSLVDRTSLPVDVHASIDRRPPDAVETAAYFVVAEALANAGKHAAAQRIDVRLDRRGTMLSVEVRDDGCGGADPDGSGVRGMRRRVEVLGGRFTVVSPDGAGTIVRAELPCER